jgi:hypothetical protein
MNASVQLDLLEPTSEEATRLLLEYVKQADHHERMADRLELLGMPGAAMRSRRAASAAQASADVFANMLDFEREAGLL